MSAVRKTGRAELAKPKKTYHHGDLYRGLLSAAESLLARHGIAGLSLREVAKAAGVSHTAPYRHFRNKTALVEALAADGFRRLQNGCETARRRYPNDPARQLLEAGLAYLYLAVEKPTIVHLMFGGVISLCNSGDDLRQAADAAWESLVRIVRDGQNAGIYQKAAPPDLTLAAWSMVHGLALMVTAGLLQTRPMTRTQIRRLGKTVAEILLSGMYKR